MGKFSVRMFFNSYVDIEVNAEDETAAKQFVEDMFYNEELNEKIIENASIDFSEIEEVE